MTNETSNEKVRRPARRGRGAFTLIELLLVMVIISILAAIVVPRLTGRKLQAQIAAAKQDISNIKVALDIFEKDNGRYPTQSEGINALVTNPGSLPDWTATLPSLPVDPWQHPYVYHFPGSNNQDYDLYSTGPSGQDGNQDNIH